MRPSAFGAPRVSRASAPPHTSTRPSQPISITPAVSSQLEDEEDDRDADTAPGLLVGSLAPAPKSNPPASAGPTGPTSPSTPDPGPSRTSQAQPAHSTGPQLQLVLAKTSLPDAPSVMLAPPAEPAPREEPRRALTSIAVFAAMICAAAVPLARYALKSAGEHSSGATSTPAAGTERRANAPKLDRAGVSAPVVTGAPPVPPVTVPAEPIRIDRLAEIMASLPAEASEASQYLVDHAVRARDSGELQLAETLLGRASELDDRNPHPAFALARLRFEQGNYEGAEGWIANAIRLRPRRGEYRMLYANILTRLGREDEARGERLRAQRYKD